MTFIKQLSREDVMFFAGETDSIYQHVAGLIILDTSDSPNFGFEYFREHCIERISLIPHFRWKLHEVPMGMDRPYWIEDEHFSFDHHIKRIALPAPGDEATLCEVAANLYSNHLDHSKPLWEIWMIEGLEGNRFAYLQKFHHCMMDGEGALKMIEIMCDFEPNPKSVKLVDKSISEARAGEVPSYPLRSSRAWQHLARLPGDAARSAYNILRPKILEQFVWPKKPKQKRPNVPTTCFNGVISSERALNATSLSLTDMMTVKKHFNVSLNDVVLAVVSGAIRDYLKKHAELPKDSLRTNIPVSLRTENDAQISNKVTTTTVTLATNLANPQKRLEAIHTESEEAKSQARAGGTGIVELFQMMPPIMISTVMDSLPAEQAPQILGANLIVSNVRGSPMPMYNAGARMEKMYPMSILTAGMGINFTCMSYLDSMDFGIVVDPDLVPYHDEIVDGLHRALKSYVDLCSAASRARKKAPRKSGTRKKAPAKKAAAKKKASSGKRASAARKATPKKKAATTKKASNKQKAAPKKKAAKRKTATRKPASSSGRKAVSSRRKSNKSPK